MSDAPAAEGNAPTERQLITVVVPAYNESLVIKQFYDRATATLSELDNADYELIFVDDGSADDTYKILRGFAAEDDHVVVIKFSRNFGHQIAITAGIDESKGDAVVVIDCDLQDPPEVIHDFVAKWRQGYDVVYGVRSKRDGESAAKRATAALFYRLIKRMTPIDIPVDVGDFRLMSRRSTEHFKKLREKDRFVRGMVSWLGFPQAGVTYDRDARAAGETKYPYKKMIKFALDGITSFSVVPLRVASWFGYLTSGLAFAYLISVFVQKAMGYTVKGFATIMVAMLFLGGVQLICMGIIGEYIGRIFNEIKPRPIYVIEQIDRKSD